MRTRLATFLIALTLLTLGLAAYLRLRYQQLEARVHLLEDWSAYRYWTNGTISHTNLLPPSTRSKTNP